MTTLQQGTRLAAKITGGNKRYPGVIALENVDFSLKPGEVRALLGKNGAGKSTLIRMLTGSESLDSGVVHLADTPLVGSDGTLTRRAAQLGVRAVYQELSLIEGLTVAENLCLGSWPRRMGVINYRQMAQLACERLNRLGVSIDPWAQIDSLSPAQKQLVEIARVMAGETSVVILDEPTSSLASAEVELVINAVKNLSTSGVAVIYVSHRMDEIRRIASSATIMRDGKVAGNVSLENTSTQQVVALMLGHEHAAQPPINGFIKQNRPALEVNGLKYLPKLVNINLAMHPGEVVGIAGLLGSGRSELLQAIIGLAPIQAGEVIVRGKPQQPLDYASMLQQGVGYTPENRKEAGIIPLLGIDENTVIANRQRVSKRGVLNWQQINVLTRQMMERMAVKAGSSETAVGTLSGGNQQKVVIGRWVYAGSQILLLDEPTRGVDIEAKQQIYRIIRELAQEGKSVLFISSEVEELPLVCDRILLLQNGILTKTFLSPVSADQLMSAMLAVH